MRIDWAIYGEQNKGHALLGSSGNPAFAALLTPYTDRPGDPPHGHIWGQVENVFPFRDHLVVMRTLQDASAGRAGMVRTYAAFVPLTDLAKVRNLLALFGALPAHVEPVPATMIPRDILDQDLSAVPSPTPLLGPLAVQLGAPGSTLPLVWGLNDDYINTIAPLWARLPVALRLTFACYFQFTPEHATPSAPQVVATSPGLANRWPTAQIFSPGGAVPASLNLVQKWLAGAGNTSALEQALSDYEITFAEFQKFNLLAEFAELVGKLDQLDFGQIRRAAIILGQHGKRTRNSAVRRSALFKRFNDLVASASVDDLRKLRNLDSKALPELVDVIQPGIRTRMESLVADGLAVSPLISLLEQAQEKPGEWWAAPMLQWLDEGSPEFGASQVVFLLDGLASPMIRDRVAASVPDTSKAEAAIIDALPVTLDTAKAAPIVKFAVERKWWRLHAACLAASLEPAPAILAHLEKAGAAIQGLNYLLEKLGGANVVRAACDSDLATLTKFVGGLLARGNVELPLRCSGRVRLVCAAVAGKEELSDTARALLVETLNVSYAGDSHFGALCERCVDRFPALMAALHDVAVICDRIPAGSRDKVQDGLRSYFEAKLAAAEPLGNDDMEFLAALISPQRVVTIFKAASLKRCVAVGLNAFDQLPFLGDVECRAWLVDYFTRSSPRFVSGEECEKIAALLLDRTFPETAKMIRDTVGPQFNRHDVSPLDQCIRYKYQMLRTFERPVSFKRPRLPRIIIATALPLEREEVIKELDRVDYDKRLGMDVGVWPPSNPLFEVCVCITGQGNMSALEASQRLMHQKPKPMFAFFVGVGGGLKDYAIGDVVYSTKVYYYESGKEEDTGVKARPEVEETSRDLVQLAHRVKDGWQPHSAHPRPKAGPAVIASGELVLAAKSPDASNFQLIKNAYNDSQAADKEAFGFLRAAASCDIKYRMVIRGISDLIAGKAESDAMGNQSKAARHATAFLFTLIKHADGLVPRTRVKKKLLGFTYHEEIVREVE